MHFAIAGRRAAGRRRTGSWLRRSDASERTIRRANAQVRAKDKNNDASTAGGAQPPLRPAVNASIDAFGNRTPPGGWSESRHSAGHRGRRRRRQTPTVGTGRAHNGCAPLAASSPDPTPRGRRRDQGGRSHARVDRAHRDGIITGAGALASNAQPAVPARQQAAETAGPQMRGGTVDAVDAADDGIALPRSLEIAIARRLSHRRISRARSRRARSRSTIQPDSMLRPRAPQSIRSSCTRRFRASSATTDTTRVEQSWDAWLDCAPEAGTVWSQAMTRRRAPTPATAGRRPH